MVVDVLFFFKATIIKTSYLGVFRRHFAPAIVLKKRKQPNCPQPTCLFPLRGQDDKKRYSGALWRVIVPWTLSGPDAHPRSRSEGIPHCFSVTGWGLWRAESPPPPVESAAVALACPLCASVPCGSAGAPRGSNVTSCTTQARAFDTDRARARPCTSTSSLLNLKRVIVLSAFDYWR